MPAPWDTPPAAGAGVSPTAPFVASDGSSTHGSQSFSHDPKRAKTGESGGSGSVGGAAAAAPAMAAADAAMPP
eukprot:4766996-Alexandrium_andersonii.AAC.1